jgi:hypothetical protein
MRPQNLYSPTNRAGSSPWQHPSPQMAMAAVLPDLLGSATAIRPLLVDCSGLDTYFQTPSSTKRRAWHTSMPWFRAISKSVRCHIYRSCRALPAACPCRLHVPARRVPKVHVQARNVLHRGKVAVNATRNTPRVCQRHQIYPFAAPPQLNQLKLLFHRHDAILVVVGPLRTGLYLLSGSKPKLPSPLTPSCTILQFTSNKITKHILFRLSLLPNALRCV